MITHQYDKLHFFEMGRFDSEFMKRVWTLKVQNEMGKNIL